MSSLAPVEPSAGSELRPSPAADPLARRPATRTGLPTPGSTTTVNLQQQKEEKVEEKPQQEQQQQPEQGVKQEPVRDPPLQVEKQEKDQERTETVGEDSVGSTTSALDDNSNCVLQQIGALGNAVAADFSGSALPSLFNVSSLSLPVPDAPIRFNTVWALHADDHPTPLVLHLHMIRCLCNLLGMWRHSGGFGVIATTFLTRSYLYVSLVQARY
ncbi:hypothetical protein LSM04_005513 [Trypanosoma melophagium]|uniref:uncharacterized protein n=1 Tax=Trypanosoma melophagium TaxID=715481 RepID=UPI00351AA380|nr:hypothetical protein LSM04_005513 [Trypanosoma melophagium]